MLEINMEDVMNIVKLCIPYLIAFAIVLVLAVIVMVACKKLSRPKKFLVRRQSWMVILLALIIVVNLICWGPMSTMITLSTGSGTISEESSAEAEELSIDIAEEGIVLLDNKEELLPMESDSKLNVFGWASTNPCYGGTGSGALSGAYPTVSLEEGLTNAGFELNKELSDFYTNYREDRPEVGMWAQDWTLPEPPTSTYSSEMMENAKNFSDTAMIVITRVGGEGADLPTDMSTITYTDNSKDYKDFQPGEHFLELSQSEKDMVDLVCSNFDNVVLVYNGANTFELDFARNYEQIKSVIWCPGTGQSGFKALGEIVSGGVNPSGKTSDTFVYDLTTTPYYNNIGSYMYDNTEELNYDNGDKGDIAPSLINYVEGIYVGYRFYETADAEGVIDYDKTVHYTFGYGLSYTDFEQTMGDIQVDGDGNISVDVTVTNTGDTAGKDTVELYYTPPYTNGGIEKSEVNLTAFDKTDLLEPGDSQTLTLSLTLEDMASYDTYGAGAWVLEAGDYDLSIRSDSHTVIDEKTLNVDGTITYGEENKRSTDEVAALNQFDFAEGDVTYLSRENGFANYEEAVAAPTNLSMSDDVKGQFYNLTNYEAEDFNHDEDEMPVTGANNGLELASMRGLSYDDESWEPLLDQLTTDDMVDLIAFGGYQTKALKSVGKAATIDCDGPASINNNFTGVGSIGMPSAVMLANSWNEDLALSFGEKIGKMADEMGVSGWYAPAMNNHRSAFAGRNFEYYSEDGFLAGKMSANAVVGAEKYGVYAYIKHFALNDQETNRNSMLATWANEQSIREIYLKPFEMAVKEGHAKAVMSAFNYIGPVWAGGCNELLNNVLRDEWGFQGMVLTDYFGGFGYMNADQAIRNGNDICLVAYDAGSNKVTDIKSATSVQAMRQASKNIMYTVVNSRAYSEGAVNQGLYSWQIAAIVIDVILACGFIVLEVQAVKKYQRKCNEEIDKAEA